MGFPVWFGSWEGTSRARRLIITEYARMAVGIAAVYGLAILAGATVEKDPRSSDFAKLRFGNTRIDFLAGIPSVITFIARIITGKTKNAKGEIKPLRGPDVKFGATEERDVMAWPEHRLGEGLAYGTGQLPADDTHGRRRGDESQRHPARPGPVHPHAFRYFGEHLHRATQTQTILVRPDEQR